MAEYLARIFMLFGLCTMLATTAVAQDERSDQSPSSAAITGQLDGAPQRWLVSPDRNLPTATFSTLTPGVHQVSITAYAGEPYTRANSLRLEFILREADETWQVSGLELRHYPFEPRHPRFSQGADHGEAELVVESFVTDTRHARLRAQVTATLFYHQSPNTSPISQRTRTLDLSLDFDLDRN